jgi:hypothetical protein
VNRLTAFRIYAFAIALVPFAMAAWLLLFANQPTLIKLVGAVPLVMAGSWLFWSGRRRGDRIAQRLRDTDRGGSKPGV